MQLIGMLDSPYVRRVAVSLQLLDLPFEHRPLSVFRTYEQFQQINPVVKAPSLICDNGVVLMDSSLILDYAEALAKPGKSLMPASLDERQHALYLIGAGLAACEKAVQVFYECKLRPEDKQHQPWLDRVCEQLLKAFGMLEAEFAVRPIAATPEAIGQAGIVAAVTWYFTQQTIADRVPAAQFPHLQAFSEQAEAMPVFKAAAHGAGTYPVAEEAR